MDRFLNAYLWFGNPTDEEAEERYVELVHSVKQELDATLGRVPSGKNTDEIVKAFRDYWIAHHLSKFFSMVCGPPPVDKTRAEGLWSVGKKRMLAGLETVLLWDLRQAFETKLHSGEFTSPSHQAVKDGLRENFVQETYPKVVELLTVVGDAFDRYAGDLIGVLPDLSLSHEETTQLPSQWSDLQQRAPVTCAVAWRFVVELQRCHAWQDDSVSNELKRLANDKTRHVFPAWDGLIWTASNLWRRYQRVIERQAKSEGKIDRSDGETNSKYHLSRLQSLLDIEAPEVAAIGKGENKGEVNRGHNIVPARS